MYKIIILTIILTTEFTYLITNFSKVNTKIKRYQNDFIESLKSWRSI